MVTEAMQKSKSGTEDAKAAASPLASSTRESPSLATGAARRSRGFARSSSRPTPTWSRRGSGAGSGVGARRHPLHRRDLQGCREDDLRQGAALEDPHACSTPASKEARRAIDLHEGDAIDEEALKALVRTAVALNASSAAGGNDERFRWTRTRRTEAANAGCDVSRRKSDALVLRRARLAEGANRADGAQMRHMIGRIAILACCRAADAPTPAAPRPTTPSNSLPQLQGLPRPRGLQADDRMSTSRPSPRGCATPAYGNRMRWRRPITEPQCGGSPGHARKPANLAESPQRGFRCDRA